MLKSGQTVQIRCNIKSFNDGFQSYEVTSYMNRLAGKVFVVEQEHEEKANCYYLLGEESWCYWHENWLMPVGSSDEEFE